MPAPGRGRREPLAERRDRRAAVEDVAVVLEAGARFLETRSRSVAEVRRRLTGAGYRKPLVEAAIERLIELGFLDDAAFARSWVDARDRTRPRGEQALRRELRLKGVDAEVIQAALARRRGVGDESGDAGDPAEGDSRAEGPRDPDLEAARRLLERRRAALARDGDPRRRRQKAYALLARNGFAPDVASLASRELVASMVADVVEDEPSDEDA